jgi:hypothetical protein
MVLGRIILACIRNRGHCPCPRCLIPLDRVHNIGMVRDMQQRTTMVRIDDEQCRSNVRSARRMIYEENYHVDSARVEHLLGETSLVPSVVRARQSIYPCSIDKVYPFQNAFSHRLTPLGFDPFTMLVVDLMHEFELGVWKALFIHLLRILHSVNDGLVAELDHR